MYLGQTILCVEIEIFDVNGHETCTFGGDDTVEESLGGKHVSCGCATIAGINNSIATNWKADAIWVISLRPIVCKDFATHVKSVVPK
jgi:hypothetical protein